MWVYKDQRETMWRPPDFCEARIRGELLHSAQRSFDENHQTPGEAVCFVEKMDV